MLVRVARTVRDRVPLRDGSATAERQAINAITELRSVLGVLPNGGAHVLIGRSVRTTKVFDALSHTRVGLKNYTGEFRAYQLLCEREHLEPVPGCDQASYSLSVLEKFLRDHGPICFGWSKPVTGGHMSVLIGTDDRHSTIEYHDPGENSGYSQMSLNDFNAKRVKHTYAMSGRPGHVSGRASRRRSHRGRGSILRIEVRPPPSLRPTIPGELGVSGRVSGVYSLAPYSGEGKGNIPDS